MMKSRRWKCFSLPERKRSSVAFSRLSDFAAARRREFAAQDDWESHRRAQPNSIGPLPLPDLPSSGRPVEPSASKSPYKQGIGGEDKRRAFNIRSSQSIRTRDQEQFPTRISA